MLMEPAQQLTSVGKPVIDQAVQVILTTHLFTLLASARPSSGTADWHFARLRRDECIIVSSIV